MVFRLLKAGYEKIKAALAKTRSLLGQKNPHPLFAGPINEAKVEALEEILYGRDLGVKTAAELTEKVRQALFRQRNITSEELIEIIKQDLLERLKTSRTPKSGDQCLPPRDSRRQVSMATGKPPPVPSLPENMQQEGNSVLLGAADTFRAAAQEQLTLWAERLKLPIVKGLAKSDPSSVVFDALSSAKAKGMPWLS